MRQRRVAPPGTSVVLLLALLCAVSVAQDGIRTGTKAPAFELPSVGGRTIALREFENKKIVIVHFWKSKWRECQAEFPPLRKIYDEFKDVAILSINPIDMKGRVEADAKYFKLPYDVLIGRDSDVLKDYRITKLPGLFIVGKNGKILVSEKYLPYDDLREEVEKALGK